MPICTLYVSIEQAVLYTMEPEISTSSCRFWKEEIKKTIELLYNLKVLLYNFRNTVCELIIQVMLLLSYFRLLDFPTWNYSI